MAQATDAENIAQLIKFHDLIPEPPDVGRVSHDRLRHLAMRSMLIDKDPAAADGHEETLYDLADAAVIRQLVHEVWHNRNAGPVGRIERDPATALAQYQLVNGRRSDS